jgi:8-oxo-dGTP pyrophosphatase MutT (NUDIX family)
VFPGGSIDDRDRTIAQELASGDELLTTMRVCAARELLEESGIWLGAPRSDVPELRRQLNAGENRASADDFRGIDEKLVWTARWITPVGVPKRFDTYFFITSVNDDMTATADDVEGVEIVWLTPDEALQRHAAGSLPLVFPTIRNLEALRGFGSVDELIASRRGATIPTILPVIVSDGGKKKIVTPDEP